MGPFPGSWRWNSGDGLHFCSTLQDQPLTLATPSLLQNLTCLLTFSLLYSLILAHAHLFIS